MEYEEKMLMSVYMKLNVYDEVKEVFVYLKEKGYCLVIFMNGFKYMIDLFVFYYNMNYLFEDFIFVDEIKQYKFMMVSYYYVKNKMNVKREEVLFLLLNIWDIVGVKNYGFVMVWVN